MTPNRLLGFARRLRRGEDGLAMITVAMLGTALILVSTVVFARGLSQFVNTSGDARWEQALASAEACLSSALGALDADEDFTTGEAVPEEVVGSAQERDWAVGAADVRADDDLVQTTGAQCVIVKPSNAQFVYAVGYSPSRESEQRRVRSLRVDYDYLPYDGEWVAKYAFLSGDDIYFRGNPTFLTGAAVGIHSNAFLDIGGSTFADGCVTSSGGSKLIGAFVQPPGCDPPGAQDAILLPVVTPRSHWDKSEYDLCPDGKVRAGPGHGVWGNTATHVPCQGQTLISDASITSYRGWSFTRCCEADNGATWKYNDTAANNGVYYAYQGRIVVVSSPGTDLVPWRVMLIAEAKGSCTTLTGGDIDLAGSPDMAPHDASGNVQLIAGRDLEISGGADFSGVAVAYEQIALTGDVDVREGSFLALGLCDSQNDRVDQTYVGGNALINNTGPVSTLIGATVELLTAVSWSEL